MVPVRVKSRGGHSGSIGRHRKNIPIDRDYGTSVKKPPQRPINLAPVQFHKKDMNSSTELDNYQNGFSSNDGNKGLSEAETLRYQTGKNPNHSALGGSTNM
jgi:hypothetical protein